MTKSTTPNLNLISVSVSLSPQQAPGQDSKVTFPEPENCPRYLDLISLQKDWDSPVRVASKVNLELLGYKSGTKLLDR